MVERGGLENRCALCVPRVRIPVSPPATVHGNIAQASLMSVISQGTEAAPSPQNQFDYVARGGESLTSIAQANGLSGSESLSQGQQLTIPTGSFAVKSSKSRRPLH